MGKADARSTEPVALKSVKGFRIAGKELSDEYCFPASVTSEKEIKISFRVGGPLVQFEAETGHRVTENEIIARLDDRDFRVDINNLRATLEASRARLKDAELQFKRYETLFRENAVSKATLDSAEAVYMATKSETNAFGIQLGQAQNALSDINLRAPVTGYINQVYTENHETVSPGQPIVSIIDTSSIELVAFIPENLVARQHQFGHFTFRLSAYPDKIFPAELKEIGQKATGAGQTYPMMLKAGPDDSIKPGMSATVSFSVPVAVSSDVFAVPLAALVNKTLGNTIVWKIDEESDTPLKSCVTVLKIKDKNMADVSGDLKKGDWIVTAGANYITEASRIRMIGSFSATNIGKEL